MISVGCFPLPSFLNPTPLITPTRLLLLSSCLAFCYIACFFVCPAFFQTNEIFSPCFFIRQSESFSFRVIYAVRKKPLWTDPTGRKRSLFICCHAETKRIQDEKLPAFLAFLSSPRFFIAMIFHNFLFLLSLFPLPAGRRKRQSMTSAIN